MGDEGAARLLRAVRENVLREHLRFQWWPWLFLAGLGAAGVLFWLEDDAPGARWTRLGTDVEPPGSGVEHAATSIGGRLRPALAAPLDRSFDLRVPPLAAPRLCFALGAIVADPEALATEGLLEAEILLVENGEAERSLFREARTVPEWASAWTEHEVDLGEAGASGLTLRFLATGEDPEARLAWGGLRLLPEPGPPQGTPVVFLSIDTLAAGHMSLYGYERPTTPCLEEFAGDAVTFDSAFCQQSWTLTSHISMFTSLFPDTHRVTLGSALPGSFPLLPALLQEAGYFTAGLVNNPYLQPEYGYARAYDYYDHDHVRRDSEGQKTHRSMEENLELVEPLLSLARVAPLFLFLHAVDPHSDWRELPYEAPEPFADRFVRPGQRELPVSDGDRSASWYLAAVNGRDATLTAEQADYFAALYDGGVAYTDDRLGRLFQLLKREDLYDSALIVLTSDHGEEFLEHGRTMHTQGYDEVLRVPLLIKLPGSRYGGTRVADQVQLVDLMPTILEILELPAPGNCEGRSLLPLMRGERAGDPPPVFAKGENHSLTPKDTYVLRTPEWKLLWKPVSGATKLYHLPRDPGEQEDVGEAYPEVRARLLGLLQEHRSQREQGFHLRVSPFASGGTLEVEIVTDGTLDTVRANDGNQLPRKALAVEQAAGDRARFAVSSDAFRKDQPVGIDFDLSAEATWIELRALHDGRPLGDVRVGAGASPGEAPLRLARDDPALVSREAPAGHADRQAAPRLWLWKTSLEGAPVHLSKEDREVLEAMGYVESSSE